MNAEDQLVGIVLNQPDILLGRDARTTVTAAAWNNQLHSRLDAHQLCGGPEFFWAFPSLLAACALVLFFVIFSCLKR